MRALFIVLVFIKMWRGRVGDGVVEEKEVVHVRKNEDINSQSLCFSRRTRL
jgi:hypothetical protein